MGYLNTILVLGGIQVIAALGLAILTGYTGLFSMGHSVYMALGGYAAAVLYMELGVPFILALILGALFAGLCSMIIGYPTFRSQLRGDYFAIATLGFAEAVRLVLNNTYKIINGAIGYLGIPKLTSPWLVLIAMLLAFVLAHSFTKSQWGRNCLAVKQDATAAQMMGVNVLKTQMTALFVSAVYCGLAGGLLAFYMAYLTPAMFTVTKSSDLLAAVVFGGMQSLVGPAIAGFVLIALPEILRPLESWRLIMYGSLFVIIMVFRPQGLLGYYELELGRYLAPIRAAYARLGIRRKAKVDAA